jgi:hypothetical protein
LWLGGRHGCAPVDAGTDTVKLIGRDLYEGRGCPRARLFPTSQSRDHNFPGLPVRIVEGCHQVHVSSFGPSCFQLGIRQCMAEQFLCSVVQRALERFQLESGPFSKGFRCSEQPRGEAVIPPSGLGTGYDLQAIRREHGI